MRNNCGRPRLNIDDRSIRFCYENGMNIGELSRTYGCSKSTIRDRVKECSNKTNKTSGRPKLKIDEVIEKMRSEDMSIKEIARKCGCSERTVSRRINERKKRNV